MPRNLGATSLKRRRKSGHGMREFDRLPSELRAWLAAAVLPWHPQSVRRVYNKALRRTQDKSEALAELDRVERRKIAKDASAVWGETHPAAATKVDALDAVGRSVR